MLIILVFTGFAASQNTEFLREVRWNAIVPPVLSTNGFDLVFGIRANGVRLWSAGNDFTQNANYQTKLAQDPTDLRLRKSILKRRSRFKSVTLILYSSQPSQTD